MSTVQYLKEIIKERIQSFQEYKKTTDVDPLQTLQKSVVLQESRCFNDTQINDKKCRQILTKLVYLLNQGETFNELESQTLFFSITKLFQSNNYELRRMIYVMIKEFRHQNSMYIVISSLTKDITSKIDLFRMNALRTIPVVLEPSNLVQIERYLKTAIIDKNYAISSAALLAGTQILSINPEIVKKWANEILDRLNNKYPQNNFHALVLLHEIKKSDSVTFTKILVSLCKENLIPIATVQIVRFAKELVCTSDLDGVYEKMFLDYILRQVHKSQEMVIFEACKALCEIKTLSNKDLQPMVQVLMMFLISTNSINKFVALKLLNKLISNPIRRSLISNTSEIEGLIHDHNKSLSSLAVSILLKICREENIEKLLNQIYEYLSEMSDEFKIDVLRSVRALVRQSPKKWKSILTFLSSTLKCEASQDFKRYAVDILENILNEIVEAREACINALADFIEDCQYAGLSLHILSILNREASKKQCSTKVIRIVNNRLHLEEPEIRAAAVGVLGKFAIHYPEVSDKILPLIEATKTDPDEEVRNRGAFYMTISGVEAQANYQKFAAPITIDELDYLETYLQNNLTEIQQSTDQEILSLQRAQTYAEANRGKLKKSPRLHPNVEDEIQKQQYSQDFVPETQDLENFGKYQKLFKESKTFNQYGLLRKISKPTELTDSKAEYLVTLTKHFFDEHIVCEFKVKNTLDSITLTNVSCELTIKNPNIQAVSIVPASKIDPESSSNVLVGLQINPDSKLVACLVQCVLNFTIKEVNAATGKVISEYNDNYQLEDFNINYSEYFVATQWYKRKFAQEWESYQVKEQQSTFQLDYKNTDIAIKELIKHFGMLVCESTDVIVPSNKYHTLLLVGKYLDITSVMIMCLIGFDAKLGCILKVTVKTDNEELTTNVLETFA